ncbi:MAG: carbohydrate binding family 9 domain-containing protein, partial [Cyclobacteriaceae bacterium]|nr:carbohydrate binding family 9 domain-containing protein [Cyclobacteriaceae bacterium]
MRQIFVIFVIFNLICFDAFSLAQDSVLRPMVTEIAPEIDGKLDDSAWETAIQISGFKTYKPDFGQDLPVKTTVYITSDAQNIYFAFRCFDSPNLVKTSISPRDKIEQDDWIRISLDSYNDNQSLSRFYVNPNGVQMDTRASGFRDDPGIDFVWYSAGQVDDEGYTVEMRIPFKSLRYTKKGEKVTMGMVFERFISRLSVNGTFPEIDPRLGNNFQLQTIEVEYSGVGKNTLIEALPSITYGIGKQYEEDQF